MATDFPTTTSPITSRKRNDAAAFAAALPPPCLNLELGTDPPCGCPDLELPPPAGLHARRNADRGVDHDHARRRDAAGGEEDDGGAERPRGLAPAARLFQHGQGPRPAVRAALWAVFLV